MSVVDDRHHMTSTDDVRVDLRRQISDNADSWAAFKIGVLRIDGIPCGTVRVTGIHGVDGSDGGIDVVMYYPRDGGEGGMVMSKVNSDEGRSVWEIGIRAVREVGRCYGEVRKFTGGGGVQYREKMRSVGYVVGDEVWGVGSGDVGDVVDVKNVGPCFMCDRHVVEEREWVGLTLRLDGALKRKVKEMVVRCLLGQGGGPTVKTRFWSTYVVSCVSERELKEILKGDVALRLEKCFDWGEFIKVVLVGLGVLLLTFGLALVALVFYLIRNALASTKRENDFMLKAFSRDFHYAQVTLLGKELPWFKELLADDAINRDLEWPSMSSVERSRSITTKRIRKIPSDGLLVRGQGKAVTVGFRVNSMCSVCSKKKNSTRDAGNQKVFELEPFFDFVVLETTADNSLKLVEYRDVCLECLQTIYDGTGASTLFFGPGNHRAASLGHDVGPGEQLKVLGLVGSIGRGAKQKHFVSCGFPQDGAIDYAVEIAPLQGEGDNEKWRSVALHRGSWTSCGFSPQRIMIT